MIRLVAICLLLIGSLVQLSSAAPAGPVSDHEMAMAETSPHCPDCAPGDSRAVMDCAVTGLCATASGVLAPVSDPSGPGSACSELPRCFTVETPTGGHPVPIPAPPKHTA